MNLILVEPEELHDGVAMLRGRRAKHILEVHRASVGDQLRIGVIGGRHGLGEVRAVSNDEVAIEAKLDFPPPPALDIDLLLALPRPKILKKVLPAVTSIGVKRIVLVNAARVERSYFGSPVLEASAIREALIAGLEQARDTLLPEVLIRNRFRPFVEDETPVFWPAATVRLTAHPVAAGPIESDDRIQAGCRMVVAIGPEGGWVPFEVQLLEAQGFRAFSLGERILRVDTVVPAVLAQLDLLRRLRAI